MHEFVVNVFQLYVTPIGHRLSSALTFHNALLDSIAVVDAKLMAIRNNLESVVVKKKTGWTATTQSLFLHDPKKDIAKGVFYGFVEVGSRGQFDHLRNPASATPYVVKANDHSMKRFFYRIEMPPDSTMGLIALQRCGRRSPALALQQSLRREFHRKDHTAHFHLVTDEHEFESYLNGRVEKIRARFQPQKNEDRKTLKDATALGMGLSRSDREEMEMELRVRRPLTVSAKRQVKDWLLGTGRVPEIVTLPVEDDPDKIILTIKTEDGDTRSLHPGMIEQLALVVDLTAKVKAPGGKVDLESANDHVAAYCEKLRPTLV